MRRKIFITYGNTIYYDSLCRIRKEAEATGFFDTVITYTDADLSDEIKGHPLFQHERGGGYWFWKPYVILKTLTEIAGPDDIVIYSDAGNEIFADKEWEKYFSYLDDFSAICFKYGGLMKQWTKKEMLDYHASYCRNLPEMWQIMGGLSLWTLKALPVVQEWYDLMSEHPELVLDSPENDKEKQHSAFREHRHDQSALSCIVYKNETVHKIKVLWEHCESYDQNGQAAFCSRIANTPERQNGRPHRPRTIFWRIKRHLRLFFRDLRQKRYR